MEEDKTTHHPNDEKGTLNEIFGLWKDKEIDLDKFRQEQWGRFAGIPKASNKSNWKLQKKAGKPEHPGSCSNERNR